MRYIKEGFFRANYFMMKSGDVVHQVMHRGEYVGHHNNHYGHFFSKCNTRAYDYQIKHFWKNRSRKWKLCKRCFYGRQSAFHVGEQR